MLKMLFTLVISVLFLTPSSSAEDACFDHAIWDSILKANVKEDGLVDYAGVRISKGGTLYEYLTFVELKNLAGCGNDERKAFWINAYNANVFRILTESLNIEKVNESNGVYSKRFEAANKNLSLKKIENRVFRQREDKGGPLSGVSYKGVDPRVHFAFVNGAKGAPRLRPQAYTSDNVNELLDADAVRFANNAEKIRLESGMLVMPAFLKWYAADFESKGGVAAYLISLTDSSLRADADEVDAKLKTDFPDGVQFVYDWTLNDTKNR